MAGASEQKKKRFWNEEFRPIFKDYFEASFSFAPDWIHGQIRANAAGLPFRPELKRPGVGQEEGELFELGDLRADIAGWTVIVEYESGPVLVHNLVKYWPYVRGELVVGAKSEPLQPLSPLLICHFSSWKSYSSYRHLWEWVLRGMQDDPARKVAIQGKQFDHWRENVDGPTTAEALQEAMTWLKQYLC